MIDPILLSKIDTLETSGDLIKSPFILSTDGRTLRKGDLFLGLNGEKFRGRDFVLQALEKGACGAIYSGDVLELPNEFKDRRLIRVSDTLLALHQLAFAHRAMWKKGKNKILIGLTGSSGKTTTKEVLFHILKSAFGDKVMTTSGNLNNQIGVPLTLLRLEAHHEIAIIEMGTNHFGEIETLAKLTLPDSGLITNIGPAHLEFLLNLEGVFKEKISLFKAIDRPDNKDGLIVLSDDDPYLRKWSTSYCQEIRHGSDTKALIKLDLRVPSLRFSSGEIVQLENPRLFGPHHFFNLAQAYLLCSNLFPESKESFAKSLSSFVPGENRSAITTWNNKEVFLDAYNSNPASLKAALLGFKDYIQVHKVDFKDLCLAVGTMFELGEKSEELHEEVGRFIALEFGTDTQVHFIGPMSNFFLKGHKKGTTWKTTNDLKEKWLELSSRAKVLFIKGSRGLQLESLLDINQGQH